MTTMRDDHDVEQLLRDTLAARGESITRPATWPAAEPAARRRRWVAPLIAAAVVAAVAVGTVAVDHSDEHPQPGHSTNGPSPSPTPTAIDTVHRACSTGLPPAWPAAVAAGTTTLGATSVEPLQVMPDGSTLVTRDFGSSRDVAVVSPSLTAHSIYSVPRPADNQVAGGAVDGRWAMLPVVRAPRFANGVIPTVVRLVVVNLDTGNVHTIATDDATDSTHVIDGAALFGGRVYYDVRARWVSRRGSVHEYDPATGLDREIASGSVGAPVVLPTGLSWLSPPNPLRPQVTRALPAPVAAEMTSQRTANGLVTDSADYVWVDRGGHVAWFGPGARTPRRTSVPLPGVDDLDIERVAGPFVFYTDQNDEQQTVRVLDSRTGATAVLPTLASDGAPTAGLTRDGVLVGTSVTGSQPSGTGAPAIPITALVRIDTTKLPELHC